MIYKIEMITKAFSYLTGLGAKDLSISFADRAGTTVMVLAYKDLWVEVFPGTTPPMMFKGQGLP